MELREKMSDKEAIKLVRSNLQKGIALDGLKKHEEALQILIDRADLLDRVGAAMPEKRYCEAKNNNPRTLCDSSCLSIRYCENNIKNEAIDLCTAAIAGKVGRIEKIITKGLFEARVDRQPECTCEEDDWRCPMYDFNDAEEKYISETTKVITTLLLEG